MKMQTNKRPEVLTDIGNNMKLDNTIFNHYETPMQFKLDCEDNQHKDKKNYIKEGVKLWNNFEWNAEQEKIYQDVHKQVQGKLISRG